MANYISDESSEFVYSSEACEFEEESESEDDFTNTEESTSDYESNTDEKDYLTDEKNTPKSSRVKIQKATSKSTKNESEKAESGSEFSEGDDPNKSCPICLLRFKKGKPIAIPDGGCSHAFCVECLREWSKNVATCPIDRSKFQNIIIQESIDGREIKKERVQKSAAQHDEEGVETMNDELWLCESCNSGAREDYLLLCDGCDLAYHYDTCLIPPLSSVPRGRWFCPTCRSVGLGGSNSRNIISEFHRNHQIETIEIHNDDDSNEDLPLRSLGVQRRAVILSDSDESEATTSNTRETAVNQRNVVPRTPQSERVRRVVALKRGNGTQPRKPLSAYFLFLQDERPRAKDDLQRLNLPCSMVDVTKEVARRWNEAKETTKAEYDRRYRVAKAEYDKVMESIPESERKPRKKKRVKRKLKNKKSSTKRKKTATKTIGTIKRRKTVKRRTKGKHKRKSTKGKKKTSKYGSNSKKSDAHNKWKKDEGENNGLAVERLSLFGQRDELVCFEDDGHEDNNQSKLSVKPLAVIRPFNSSNSCKDNETTSTSSNILGDIMAGQKNLLKLEKQKVKKMSEVYSKGSADSSSKLISTTVSRSVYQDKNYKKSNDTSKIKNSAMFMARFLSKNNDTESTKNLGNGNDNATEIKPISEISTDERKRTVTESETKSKHPSKNDDNDKSVADLVSDIIDDIDLKEKENIHQKPNTYIAESSNLISETTKDNHRKKELLNGLQKDSKCNNLKWTEIKNEFSQNSHISCLANTGKKDLQFQKINECKPSLSSKELTTVAADKSGIYSKFANILDSKTSKFPKINETNKLPDSFAPIKKNKLTDPTIESTEQVRNGTRDQNVDISKDTLQYYQPNYLPSSGKGVPNNIPKSGLSSSGLYKNKLEQQTLIGQQIKIYLKPAFNQGVIEKNTYKTIMKKCVDKVYEKSKTDHVSTDRVKRLVEAYITQERQNAIKEKLALKR